MCRLPSQAEPSKTPFPITDLSNPVSYHCAIQPSTINPDLSVLSSSAPDQDKMYGWSLDQPILPLGLSVSFSIAISLLRLLMTHSLFVFLLRFPLLGFLFFWLFFAYRHPMDFDSFQLWLLAMAFGRFNSVSLWSRMAGLVSHRCFSFLYCD